MEEQANKKRYFKCFHNGIRFGRFKGRYPQQAANKAFASLLIKLFNSQNPPPVEDQEIRFSIIETTWDSNKNSYTYVGRMKLRDEPWKAEIWTARAIKNGLKENVAFRYKNIVKRDAEYELVI